MILSRVKSRLPWWAKIGLKICLSRIPVSYQRWQQLGLFRHGYMDAAAYALAVFEAHRSRAGLEACDLEEKTLVEIGPGDSIATAVIAYAYGARAILVDTGPYARSGVETYEGLITLLADRGLRIPDLTGVDDIEALIEQCNGVYLTQGLESWSAIADDSVDFIFSQAVLEHVRKHQFPALLDHCFRVMRPVAVASHRIDLRDHLGGALNNLRFSETRWESPFFVRSGFYTNRIQMPAMLAMFEAAGFAVEFMQARRWEALPTPREKLNASFAGLPEEALNVSGFDVVLRRKTLCAA